MLGFITQFDSSVSEFDHRFERLDTVEQDSDHTHSKSRSVWFSYLHRGFKLWIAETVLGSAPRLPSPRLHDRARQGVQEGVKMRIVCACLIHRSLKSSPRRPIRPL